MSDEPHVDIELPDGTKGSVPQSGLADAVAKYGAKQIDPVAPPQSLARQAVDFAKSTPELVATAGLGAARGATMGLSDADALDLGYAIGGDKGREIARKQLEDNKKKHPELSMASELAGAVAPSFLSGGATAPRAIKAAAPLLERIGGAALEEAPQALETLGKGVAPALEEGAASGAAKGLSAGEATVVDGVRARPQLPAPAPAPVELAPNELPTNVGGRPATVHPAELVEPSAVAATPKPAIDASAVDAFGKTVLADTSIGKAAGIASEAAPDATAAFAKGSALPTDVLAQVGEHVEKGILKALGGEGQSLLGKIAKGTVSGAGRGAVEGAVYGTTDELNEERLGNVPLNGEKLLAAMGHGALFGALTGGALSGGAPLLRHVGGELANKVGNLSGQLFFKALDARGGYMKAAERVPGGPKAIGDYLGQENLIRAGERLEDFAPRIHDARVASETKMDSIIDSLDAKGIHGPELEKIVTGINAEALDRLRIMPSLNAAQISKVNDVVADIARASNDGKLTFAKARELRARIDDAINFNPPPVGSKVNETAEALKGARKALENEIEGAMDRAGGSYGQSWRDAKLEYRKLRVADDAAGDALSRKAKNNIGTPTDYAAGIAAAAGGHPLVGLASALAHHVLKERGTTTAAVLADKIGSLGIVKNAIAHVDRQVNRGIGRAFGEDFAPVKVKDKVLAGPESHADRMSAVVNTLTENHGEQIGNAVAPIAAHAPQIASAFVNTTVKAAAYLRSLLPPAPENTGLQPHLYSVADNMSSSEKATFERSFHVVNDPLSIMARLEDGTITPDEVQALQATHPQIYAQMKDEVASRLAATKKPISRELRIGIATFLNDPSFAGPTYDPEYIASSQAMYAPNAPQPNQGNGGKKRRAKKAKDTDLHGIVSSRELTGLSKSVGKDLRL